MGSLLAVQFFNSGSVFGLVGLIFLVVTPFAIWWLQRKTHGEGVWKSAAEAWEDRFRAAREGEIEAAKRATDLKARLEERAVAYDLLVEQNSLLLDRSPEALWAVFSKHMEDAEAHWGREEERLAELRAMKEQELKLLRELRETRKEIRQANGG
jgi:hypothetical protein